MTKVLEKKTDTFHYYDIGNLTDVISIISKYYGRTSATGYPSGKTDKKDKSHDLFIFTWFCEICADDIVVMQWNKKSGHLVMIGLDDLHMARYREKSPISDKVFNSQISRLYALGGELVACGYKVEYV